MLAVVSWLMVDPAIGLNSIYRVCTLENMDALMPQRSRTESCDVGWITGISTLETKLPMSLTPLLLTQHYHLALHHDPYRDSRTPESSSRTRRSLLDSTPVLANPKRKLIGGPTDKRCISCPSPRSVKTASASQSLRPGYVDLSLDPCA
ncbi:hypothetical protein BDV19DRAFT_80752 [Aspergillus venezuelensis]